LHQQTSPRLLRIAERLGGREQHALDGFSRGGRLQSLVHVMVGGFGITIQHFAK
jgi:hypothetical protein